MHRVLTLLVALAAPLALAQRVPADARATFDGLSQALSFVENRGQWDERVLFLARFGGADVWVTADAVVFDFHVTERDEHDAPGDGGVGGVSPERGELEATRRRGHVVAMWFEGGRARRVTGRGQQQAYHNYFLGNDHERWATHVRLYDEVVLEDLYDGVNLRLYADDGLPRYDLVLAPGVDLGRVRMRLEGADDVALAEEGALALATALGSVEHRGLLAYQSGPHGRRETVASAFVWEADGAVKFVVEGADPHRSLVLDPLVWSTFLGGSQTDGANAVAVDTSGSATVVGVAGDRNFPTTVGAYDTSFNGGLDAFVARLSADGSTLLWSTFLGGASQDSAQDIVVGSDGSATVVGRTSGEDFPATAGAYDTSFNGNDDAFIVRLSADGSTLRYSTFLGGTSGDRAHSVGEGPDGSVTLAGYTGGTGFPVTPGAYDTSYNGAESDVYVARLSADGSALRYATFLGGTFLDSAEGISVGSDGSAVVAGYTLSTNFPATAGAYDTSHDGSFEAFVARLSPDGSILLYSTFLGGMIADYAYGVAASSDGGAAVAGYTSSADFPATPGAYDTSFNGGNDAFTARLSADGSALLYSTFLGGTSEDSAYSIAVGSDGSATVAGRTEGAGFPVAGPNDTAYRGGTDAFVARLSPDGGALLYSTFLGGIYFDSAEGVGVGADGRATIVGSTFDAGFPATPGAYDTSFNGSVDAFIARFNVGTIVTTEPGAEGLSAAVMAPNPASDGAALLFALAHPSPVRIALYDVLGREVTAADAGLLSVGTHHLGLDLSGLSAGVYVWRFVVNEQAQTGRLIVAR